VPQLGEASRGRDETDRRAVELIGQSAFPA